MTIFQGKGVSATRISAHEAVGRMQSSSECTAKTADWMLATAYC